MGRLDRTGLPEIPQTARSLTSRDVYCESTVRRIEPTIRGSHAQECVTQTLPFVTLPRLVLGEECEISVQNISGVLSLRLNVEMV
jgi:hypothetical protein